MYPDIKDRDASAERTAARWLPDLIWLLPAGAWALGYYIFDLRGWVLWLFVGLSIVATTGFGFYFAASSRDRRA